MKAMCKLERVLRMCIVASRKESLPQAPTMWLHVTFGNCWESMWEPQFPHEINIALLLAGL